MGHKADINFHISERKIQRRHILKGDMFMKYEIPIWEKSNLSLEEAAGYFLTVYPESRTLTKAALQDIIYSYLKSLFVVMRGGTIHGSRELRYSC